MICTSIFPHCKTVLNFMTKQTRVHVQRRLKSYNFPWYHHLRFTYTRGTLLLILYIISFSSFINPTLVLLQFHCCRLNLRFNFISVLLFVAVSAEWPNMSYHFIFCSDTKCSFTSHPLNISILSCDFKTVFHELRMMRKYTSKTEHVGRFGNNIFSNWVILTIFSRCVRFPNCERIKIDSWSSKGVQ